MSTFQIQNSNGTFKTINHKEFYETLNREDGYLYYKQGGTHLALLPTSENLETIRTCRQAENVENRDFAVNSRCRNTKGSLCRYQHDECGSIIRDKDGKPVVAKCGNCPRNGWTAGNRANCCIRNYCKAPDCNRCPNPREYHVPLSLERFMEDEYDGSDAHGGEFGFADPNADIVFNLISEELDTALHTALNRLPQDEQAVIKAIFWDKLSQRAYSSKSGLSRSVVKRLYERALFSLKNILKNFQ